MSELAHVEIVVHGQVQGVFFRAFTSRVAKSLGLKGYVRNLPHGSVEIHAEGNKNNLDDFVDKLHAGPPESLVEKVDVIWSEFTGQYVTFDIK